MEADSHLVERPVESHGAALEEVGVANVTRAPSSRLMRHIREAEPS